MALTNLARRRATLHASLARTFERSRLPGGAALAVYHRVMSNRWMEVA